MTASHRRVAVVAVLAFATAITGGLGAGVIQEVLPLDGDVSPVQDPVVIKEKNTYPTRSTMTSAPNRPTRVPEPNCRANCHP